MLSFVRALLWALLSGALLSGCVGAVGDGSDVGRVEGGDGGAAPDAGAGRDAGEGGASDAGQGASPDAGQDAGDLIPVFVAVGKQQRRAISCDDGRTWTNDVSVDDAWPVAERYRCFSGSFALPDGGSASTDCDHNEYSSTALLWAEGAFLQATGWGAPGRIFRSTDGVSWAQVDLGLTTTDLMFDQGRLITATRGARRSDDLGLSWQGSGTIDVANGGTTIWNVRGGVGGGGVFLVTANDGSNYDFQFSTDRGATWQRPTLEGGGRVDVCRSGHPAFGNGVFVTAAWDGTAMQTVTCRSADGARTWTSAALPNESFESRVLWTGAEFIAFGNGKAYRSVDGAAWTTTPTQTRRGGALSAGPTLGAVARSPAGTFVAVRGGWQAWYENQRFYRSSDGLLWDELPAGSFEPGHPITAIAFGLALRSAACP